MSEILALQRDPSDPDIEGLDVVSDALLPSSSTAYRLRHFDSETWNLSAESSLVKLAKALLGDAGVSQVAKRVLMSRLQGAIRSTHFFDLDRFYGALFGLRRSASERLTFDPSTDKATAEEWEDASRRDASYRSRIEQFARAISFGPTPLGMELIAEAVLGVDCDIQEVWRTADRTYQTWGDLEGAYATWGDLEATGLTWGDVASPGDGLAVPGLNRREFVIRPRRAITEAERYDVMRVIDRFRPVDSIVTVDASGLPVHTAVVPRAIEADSEHWEVISRVASQRVGTEQPYFVESDIPEEQPRSAFVGYQGEAWSYNPEIAAIQGYLESVPDEPVMVSGQPGLLYQRIEIGGSPFDFSPHLALMPKRQVLAGRYASDGVLASDPYASTRTVPGTGVYGDFYVDAQGRVFRASERPTDAPVSGIAADGISVESLLAALDAQDEGLAIHDRVRFWATPERPQSDPIREVLEFRLTSAKPVNYITFDAAHYPQSIMVQAWDETTASWVIVARHTIGDSVPAQPSHVPHAPDEHPQHFGANHWVKVGGRLDAMVTSQRFRIVLQRSDGTPPMAKVSQIYSYSLPQKIVNYVWKQETFGQSPFREDQVLATHQAVIPTAELTSTIGQNLPPGPPGMNGGWFIASISDTAPRFYSQSYTADAPVPYGLAVRGLDVGFRISSRDDIPALPTGDPIGESQNILGHRVEFRVREQRATNLIGNSGGVWRSEPQPISRAVVNLYVDTTNASDEPQVIDRWYMDPIKPGVRLNLYHSSDDTDADFTGSEREIPYGGWTSSGTITSEQGGLRLSNSDPAYIDFLAHPLGWRPDDKWWLAAHATLDFHDTTDLRVLFDLSGIRVWIKAQQIVIAQPSGERAEASIAFRRGDTISIVAAHDSGVLRIIARVGASEWEAEAPYSTPLPEPSVIRVGGPLTSVSAPPAILLRSLSLRMGTPDADTLATFFERPTAISLDRTNSVLRFHPTFVTSTSLFGFRGGPGVSFEDVEWKPIRGDYVVQRGFLEIAPTAAKYWKFEFTDLAPEPYETFLPINRHVKTFPPSVTLRQAQRELGGQITSGYPGMSTETDLSNVVFFADSVITITPPPDEQERMALDVLVPNDPTATARLRERSSILGYHDWHSGYAAPQWPESSVHRYEVAEIRHDQRIGYFVGLNELTPHRVNYLAEDDTPVYIDTFDDLSWVESNEWTWADGRFTLADHQGDVKTITSRPMLSSSPVRAIQFAAQQSQPKQLLLDPDFRDGKLIGYGWDNAEYWHINGSASALFDPATFSVSVRRSVIVGGVVIDPTHGVARPIVHEIGSSESITMPDSGGADASLGGLSSELVQASLVGQVWGAVRFSVQTDLETPLLLQIVTENGLVVAQRRLNPQVDVVTEEMLSYVVGSRAPADQKLRIRLVQVGNTTDAWTVESMALFDEGVLWEFSADDGNTWTPALNVRSNAHGVLSFDRPGRRLRWRLSGGRDRLHLTSLKIRPWYGWAGGPRPARPIHGPNLSPADVSPSVLDDPEFRQWTHPIPRSWFKRYQPIPTLRATALTIPGGELPGPTDATVETVTVVTASLVPPGLVVGGFPITQPVSTSTSIPAPAIVVVNNTSPTVVLATVGTTSQVGAALFGIVATPTPAVVDTTTAIPVPTITSTPDGTQISRTSDEPVSEPADGVTRRAVFFRSAEE